MKIDDIVEREVRKIDDAREVFLVSCLLSRCPECNLRVKKLEIISYTYKVDETISMRCDRGHTWNKEFRVILKVD